MFKPDIERFCEGAQKIDEMRANISRTINAMIALMEKSKEWGQCGSGKVAVHATIGASFNALQFVSGSKNKNGREVVILFSDPKIKWVSNASSIHYRIVPVLYKSLPDIVRIVDKYLPDAGIKDYFEFITTLAKQ
jgi:hypothetical protein